MSLCNICPRKCNIDRDASRGFCRESNTLRVARIAPHHFEEPPISGTRGSGTVFFSGCSLRCVFCQNKSISRDGGIGREISPDRLGDEILALQDSGVHNINLVTPTHFVHKLAPLLEELRGNRGLKIPVVYNSSGYERVETLRMLDGLVDIYLPDFKYSSGETSMQYSAAPDYPEVAEKAISEMLRQTGAPRYSDSEPNILAGGVIVRHLVLPAHKNESIETLERLAKIAPPETILLSLMSQYTPEFAFDTPYKELHRRVTTLEYTRVVEAAERLGFNGFIQAKSSASSSFTPDFDAK